MKTTSHHKAFTLIELLVVIAIISLLSSIVYASVGSARQKAGALKTTAQGKEIEKGVELARTTLLSNSALSSSALTNKNTSKSIAKKPQIAKAIFPQLADMTDQEIIANVPRPSSLITPEGFDEYYYLSDGKVACIDSYPPGSPTYAAYYSVLNGQSNCAPIKCGSPDAPQREFTITYWVDTTGYDDPTDAPGYDGDRVVIVGRNNNNNFQFAPENYIGQFGGNPTMMFYSPPTSRGHLHCAQ